MLSLAIRCSFSFRLTILKISPNSQEPTLLHKPVNADQGKMSSLYLPYLDYLKFWKLLERLSLYKSIAFWLFHNKILYCTSGNKLQLYLSTVSWGINLLWSKDRTKFLCWNSMSHENLSFFQVFSCGKKIFVKYKLTDESRNDQKIVCIVKFLVCSPWEFSHMRKALARGELDTVPWQ